MLRGKRRKDNRRFWVTMMAVVPEWRLDLSPHARNVDSQSRAIEGTFVASPYTPRMPPQEIILSSCSGEASSSSAPGRSVSAPAIHTHDLLSAAPLHAFKTSTAGPASTSFVPSQHGVGGAVFAVQEGKALAHVWAWQKVCSRSELR